MNNNNPLNGNLRFKKSAIAVASALAFLSLTANAIDADSSANAGPLGASASAATGVTSSASTSNSTTVNPSASASASGNYDYDDDTSASAAAAASGMIDNGRDAGADADSDFTSDINNAGESITSSATASANASTTIDIITNDGYASYAGAAITEARSSVENKTVNQAAGSAIELSSSSASSARVYVDTYDYDEGTDNAYAEAASASAAAAFSSAIVKTNTVNNTGSINSAGRGILLNADSGANAEADAVANAEVFDTDSENGGGTYSAVEYATADAESYSEAVVGNNTVNNSGAVSAVDAAIEIGASSNAYSYATATAFDYSPEDADSWAVSKVIQNTINNTGSLTSTDGAGILLFSDAYAYDSEGSTSIAESFVNDNTIVNKGTIDADTSGISLQAWSSVGQYSDSLAEATINDNTIQNTGTLIVRNAWLGAGVDIRAVSGFNGVPSTANSYVENNTVSNSGVIAVSGLTTPSLLTDYAGFGADGIRLRAYGEEYGIDSDAVVSGNTISNTGHIYAEDDGLELSAVHNVEYAALVSGNTIDNTYAGRIVAKDVGVKVFSNGNVSGNTIRNSGLIVSDTGMSLDGANLIKSNRADFDNTNLIGTAILVRSYDDVHAENNQLILNAPSYLAGTILLDKNADVEVALNSGVSHSVRWAIQRDSGYFGPGGNGNAVFGQEDQGSAYNWAGGSQTRAVLNGPNPWFVNEGVVDINGQRNDVYATIDPSAFSAATNMLADLSGMVSTMAKSGMSQIGDKNGVWVTAHGNRMNYDGDKRATMDQDTRLMGGSVGYTHHFDGFKAGVMAGYSNAELQVGSFYRDLYKHSYDNDIKGAFAGLHANADIGWLNVNAGLSGGRLNHDDKRFVNDNLKWWGASYATSDYDSTWYSPELTLSVPFEAGENLTITPNLHLQYTKQNIDSYNEKGSDSNARVSSRDIAVSEAKVGLDVSKTVGMARFTGRVGYLNRNSHGDNSVRVTMIGDTQDVPFFYQDINAVYVGAAVNINLGDRVDFNLSGNYLTGKDFENGGNVTGMLRFKY